MSKGFFRGILDKGKALLEKAKPSFMKGTSDLADICDGFVKLPSQTDSARLRSSNPYFSTSSAVPAAASPPPVLPSTLVVVVGFHHKKGSIIEYTFPEEAQATLQTPPFDEFGKKICFVAIPDAIHTLESDYAFFVLHQQNEAHKLEAWFGVACFRQIESSLLPQAELYTRSYVQKAVCIISRTPLFALMLNKVHPTTHAYFNQENFEDRKILHDLYVNMATVNNSNIEYPSLFTGFPLRQLILFMKENIMTLLKLIILERKVVVYSHKPSVVSGFILSVCALIPGLLSFGGERLSSRKVSAFLVLSSCKPLQKSEEMYGLPLHVYNNKTFLIPMFTLNDLDLLSELNGYTIGTTNILLLQLPQVKADAYINIDARTFVVENKKLESALRTSSYEHTMIKKLLKVQLESYIPWQTIEGSNPTRPGKEYDEAAWSCFDSGIDEGVEQFRGSNDFVRKKFAKYFHKLMLNLSFAELVARDFQIANTDREEESHAASLKKLRELYDGLQSKTESAAAAGPKHALDYKGLEGSTTHPPADTVAVGKKEFLNESTKVVEAGRKSTPLSELEERFESLSTGVPVPKKQEEDKEAGPKFDKEQFTKKALQAYNARWLKEWQFTINYRMWQLIHSSKLFSFSDLTSSLTSIICHIDAVVECTIYYENGDIYIGEVCRGKRHGNGTLSYDNGESIYEGEWKEDKRHGKGRQITKQGKYSGQFVDDLFGGSGAYCEADGTVYDGDWLQGAKNGMAHVKYANGESYVGEYKFGKRHGKGQYTYTSGEIYSGEFVNNMRHGVGYIIKEGGVVAEGTWVEDKYLGSGNQLDSNFYF